MEERAIQSCKYLKLDDRFTYLSISKNAITTLKDFSYQILWGSSYDLDKLSKDTKFSKFYCVHFLEPLIIENDISNKFRFFIYRDPIKRFISLHKNAKIHFERIWKNYSFIEMINYAYNIYSTSYNKYMIQTIDEHFRKQFDYIKCQRYKPHFYVDISDIDNFIEYIGYNKKLLNKKINLSPNINVVEYNDPILLNEIRNLYKEDYELLNLFPSWRTFFKI